MRDRIAKQLGKQGYRISWGTANDSAVILTVAMEPGNQFMRWLLPFSSPAVVNIQGRINVPLSQQTFTAKGSAHFGLFGGSPTGMLKVAGGVAAGSIAKQILKMPPATFG